MTETAPPGRHQENPFRKLKSFIHRTDHSPKPTPEQSLKKPLVTRRHLLLAAGAGFAGVLLPREVSANPLFDFLPFGDSDSQRTIASLSKRTTELEKEVQVQQKELPETKEEILGEVKEAMLLPLNNHTRWILERRAVLATAAIVKSGPWDLDLDTRKPKGLALAETLITPLTNQYARDGLLEIIWIYRQTGLVKDLRKLDQTEIDWAKNPEVTTVYNGRETEFMADPRMLAYCHDAQNKIREILKEGLRKEHPEYNEITISLLAGRKTPDVGTLIGIMTLETTFDLYYDGRRQAMANIGGNPALAKIEENNPEELGNYKRFVDRLTFQTGLPFDRANLPSSIMGAMGPQMMIYNLEHLKWEADPVRGIPEPDPFHPLGAVIYTGLFLAEAGYDSYNPSAIREAVVSWNRNKPDEATAILAIRASYVRNIEQTRSSSRGGFREAAGPDNIE